MRNENFFRVLSKKINFNIKRKDKELFSWNDIEFSETVEVCHLLFKIWRAFEYQAASVSEHGSIVEKKYVPGEYTSDPMDNIIMIIFIKSHFRNKPYLSSKNINDRLTEDFCDYTNYRRLDERLTQLVKLNWLEKVAISDIKTFKGQWSEFDKRTKYVYQLNANNSQNAGSIKSEKEHHKGHNVAAYYAAPLQDYIMKFIAIINYLPQRHRELIKNLIK
jgi:hypothetical protein